LRIDFFLVFFLFLFVVLTICHDDRINISIAITCVRWRLEADSTRVLGLGSIVFVLHVINISVIDKVFLIFIEFSVLFIIVYFSPALQWGIIVHQKAVPVRQRPQKLRWIRGIVKLEAFV
jgi:hypothetical protein